MTNYVEIAVSAYDVVVVLMAVAYTVMFLWSVRHPPRGFSWMFLVLFHGFVLFGVVRMLNAEALRVLKKRAEQ